jgi:hypothetical protein
VRDTIRVLSTLQPVREPKRNLVWLRQFALHRQARPSFISFFTSGHLAFV